MDAIPKQFGLIIAYLLPGFIALTGLPPLLPVVSEWFGSFSGNNLGIGPPVYAILAATTLGMLVSSIRWFLIDHLHNWLGVKPPGIDYAAMTGRLQEFNYIVEGNYRYYQFNANTLVALVWAYGINRVFHTWPLLGVGTDLGALILCAILFVASRDALAKYYSRVSQLLGSRRGESGHSHDERFSSSRRWRRRHQVGPGTQAPSQGDGTLEAGGTEDGGN